MYTGDAANHMNTEDMKTKYSNLGLITVHARPYKMDHDREAFDRAEKLQDLGVVPEKALKGQALSLSTRFMFTAAPVPC
jgi:hypothetical protein